MIGHIMSMALLLCVPNAEDNATSALFNRPFRAASMAADIDSFKTAFDAIIADDSELTAGEVALLDEDSSGTIDEADRDYWLDKELRTHSSLTNGRLVFADETPESFNESDPLGLGTGRGQTVVIIDHANANGVYVGAVGAGNSNKVYTDAARTTPHATTFLFGGSNDNSVADYNFGTKDSSVAVPWKDLPSLQEFGGASGRRFPKAATPITIYIRGCAENNYSAYTLDELTRIKNNSGATEPSRIIVRAYPGENVHVYCGCEENTTDVFSTDPPIVQERPDYWFQRIIFHGFRVDGSDRIFSGSQGIMEVSTTAARWRLRYCTVKDFRAISPAHASAGARPELVDYGYLLRDADDDDVVDSDNFQIHGVVLKSNDAVIEYNYFEKGAANFPDIGLGATEMRGEALEVDEGVDGVTIRYNTFAGCAPHYQVRLNSTSNATVEYNDVSNGDQGGILYSGVVANSGTVIEHNYIHDFAVTGVQGHGLQLSGLQNATVRYNTISNPDQAESVGGTAIGVVLDTDIAAALQNVDTIDFSQNILYKAGLSIIYATGDDPGVAQKLLDIVANENVIVGAPPTRFGTTSDTPLLIELGTVDGTLNGNAVTSGIIRREENGGTVMIRATWSGGVQTLTSYTISQVATGASTFTGNVDTDPGWNDPDNGDFTGGTYPFTFDETPPLQAFATGPDA